MFYLYLKYHNITGLKYLGYTKNDPYKYRGSGSYWKKHIQKHGNDVTTEILYKSEKIEDISQMGEYYSKLWNIVDNKEFANLCEEDGNKLYGKANINFMGHPQTIETREKISKNNGRGNMGKTGKNHPAFGHKVPHKIYNNVKKMIDKNKQNGPWNKGMKGIQVLSEETKYKIRIANKGKNKEQVICPNCNKVGGKPAMMRFHFDNCKEK